MNPILEKINEFRAANGRPRIEACDALENSYCAAHARHMAYVGIAHAPAHLRPGKAEAVAICNLIETVPDTVGHIIFICWNNSPMGHREVLLKEHVAYGIYESYFFVHFVVRGW